MRLFALSAVLVVLSSAAVAQPAPPSPAAQSAATSKPVDYADAAAWVCRPGQEGVCTKGLDARVVSADGARTPEAFQPAVNPPIDCFYVYPTVSQEDAPYSDMAAAPEVQAVVRSQAGRLTSRCRLFAPLYRQITMSGLRQDMATGAHLDFRAPYRDVLAAWRWYMANENHGRGVVLLGHSQGTILLQRLIVEEIDGKPAQKRLVSAFLAGDPSLAVPPGARVGGDLKSIPTCGSAAEVGCVYVWADYLADDASPDRNFGHNDGASRLAACVSPAAPGGGVGALKAYLPKPVFAPTGDPPWIALVGQLSAQCVSDAQGDVVRVAILPGRYAGTLEAGLKRRGTRPGWGLHSLDMNLAQGSILEVLAAESATWARR